MNKIQILTGASIFGAFLVSLGISTGANLVWSISNPLLVLHNLKAGQTDQARMFGVFSILAFLGVGRICWGVI